jgi:hypothetical protein
MPISTAAAQAESAAAKMSRRERAAGSRFQIPLESTRLPFGRKDLATPT